MERYLINDHVKSKYHLLWPLIVTRFGLPPNASPYVVLELWCRKEAMSWDAVPRVTMDIGHRHSLREGLLYWLHTRHLTNSPAPVHTEKYRHFMS